MNTKTTTRTSNPEERLLNPGQAIGTQAKTLYRVGWEKENEKGTERDVYTSFVAAVTIANMLQQSVNDSPISAQFHVQDNTGKTVYSCQ
jgi:hypothetical protein